MDSLNEAILSLCKPEFSRSAQIQKILRIARNQVGEPDSLDHIFSHRDEGGQALFFDCAKGTGLYWGEIGHRFTEDGFLMVNFVSLARFNPEARRFQEVEPAEFYPWPFLRADIKSKGSLLLPFFPQEPFSGPDGRICFVRYLLPLYCFKVFELQDNGGICLVREQEKCLEVMRIMGPQSSEALSREEIMKLRVV